MTQSVGSENRGKGFYPPEGYGLKRHRFTVDDFYKMLDAGILYEGQQVELIEGILIRHGSDQPHLFHNGDVEKMLDVGLLREGDRVELIEGELFDMVAMYNPHVYAVAKLNRELTRAYPQTL